MKMFSSCVNGPSIMTYLRYFLFVLLFLCFSETAISKIVLPHKLRYLENMLKAGKLPKVKPVPRVEKNGITDDGDKAWSGLLEQYPEEKQQLPMNDRMSGANRRATGMKPYAGKL